MSAASAFASLTSAAGLSIDPSRVSASLMDPSALAIVLAGTVIATFARSGSQDMGLAFQSLVTLAKAGVDENANRKALARGARAIRQRGVLGAESAMPPDADLANAIKALLRTGSFKALRDTHAAASAENLRKRGRAVRVFEQAGDLARVCGLVGTFFSMS